MKRQRRKEDETHLWAELTGIEHAIRGLLDRENEIRNRLQQIENNKALAIQSVTV